jgi:hypothetical protein
MSNTQQRALIGTAIVLVLGIVGYVAWKWRPANSADRPEGILRICQNPQCRHEFSMTVKQDSDYAVKHYGEAVACPKCGQKKTILAERCPKCKRLYPAQKGGAGGCPFCSR